MKNATESSGSESRSHDELFPNAVDGQGEGSGTVSFVPKARDRGSSVVVNEDDKTVISQRPVAPPEEFYRSMPLAELAVMLEGKQLDHFLVETMIGGGGMGAVFRGVDTRLDRVVAVKVIPAAKRDPETLRRFRLEAQAAARLDHPNIARVYYVGEADQWNYIVFEFIDGINIRDLVEMEGPLSVDDAVFYARQVAEALHHAHERDVVHRDVKPSNVLVTAGGIAKLVDMGLARDTSLDKSTADATASGVTLGTFDYISPEQARNPRDADVRSDLYSLGCTLFYMLTGNPPFPEGTALQKLLNHGSQPPPDPRGWRDDLSDELYEVMMKLMAKRPADRYQKPAELVNDLLLLADLENLPRSQGPSTLLLSPSVAQRSLLETNLPWMVAFSFLLGSTLWLQSFQTLSNGITLQSPKFKAQVDAQPTTDGIGINSRPGPEITAPPSNSPPLESRPTEGPINSDPPPRAEATTQALPKLDAATNPALNSVETLVVSAFQPQDVPAELWEASLATAIQRLSSQINAIQVRGVVKLQRPIRITGRELEIRGDPKFPAFIDIDPNLLGGDGAVAAITLHDAKFKMEGVGIRTSVSSSTATGARVFHSSGNSSVLIDGCSVTVLGDNPTAMSVIQIGDELPDNYPMARTIGAENRVAESAMTSIRDSFIRGSTSLISVIEPSEPGGATPRIELSFEDVLVAIDGVAINLKATANEIDMERMVRLFCTQSTFVTSEGFAKLWYEGSSTPHIGLNRTSKSCIYWSKPDVAHIAIYSQSAGLLENPNLMLLQGIDNAYDANVEHICQTFSAGTQLFDLSFSDGQQEGWLTEKSSDRTVRWKTSVVSAQPFSQATASEFNLVEGTMFVPGYLSAYTTPPIME